MDADGEAPPSDRIVSYAQNFEDVMLHRALSDVERGTYVDVGAAWPTADSVTRLFYDRGWSGINIEPNPALLAELERERPRDVNLGVAIADEPGTATFAVVQDTGLSTLDTSLAGDHADAGWAVSSIDVDVRTLGDVLEEHRPEGDIHFLKVDVEGYEAAVIAGNDWTRFRPWIVVAEVVVAGRVEQRSADWEPLLLSQGYSVAYADGLNRFYVAEEHADLLPRFEFPPNIYDGFVTARLADVEGGLVAAEAKIGDLEWRLGLATERATWLEGEIEARVADTTWQFEQRLEAERSRARSALLFAAEARTERDIEHEARLSALDAVADRDREIARLRAEGDELRHQLHVVTHSKSWQVTRPLRIFLSLKQAPGPGFRFLASRLLRRPLPPPPVAVAPVVETSMTPAQSDFHALVEAIESKADRR